MSKAVHPLSIVVVGASGDLARRKIFPALFALFCQGHLPPPFTIFGFARTALSHEGFRRRITEHLTCRYAPGVSCADRMDQFLSRCYYRAGQYDSADAFLDLYEFMRSVEGEAGANRMFYLAIPPSVFLDVARAIGNAGLVRCTAAEPWSRVVIEKPFGRDRESSDVLTRELARVFTEDQTYRIDHYLGKEVIQNLMVLRFANLVFEPVWNSRHIESVTIDWRESIGVGDRGGYFDGYGIVRDVLQNHLLQILALVAMEKPRTTGASDVRDAKVAVLRSVPPLALKDIALGQYAAGTFKGAPHPGYLEEPSVPPESVTPTYAAVVLRVNNERWQGVPFLMKAGKALGESMNEVRIGFRGVSGNIFCDGAQCPPANELVVRIQPDEAIYLRIVNKQPGLAVSLVESSLDLRYQAAFSTLIPDAYECLLLDVLQGDKSLFIRSDELEAAWDVFTPMLREVEARRIRPEPYAFGTEGPAGVRKLFDTALKRRQQGEAT